MTVLASLLSVETWGWPYCWTIVTDRSSVDVVWWSEESSLSANNCLTSWKFKENSHQKISVAYMIELLLKSLLVYHSPMFEAYKVPKRPVEVPCDVTQHLVACRTAVETRTNSSGMCTHTGQQSRLPCMHTLTFAWLVAVCSVQKSYRNWRRHSALALYKGNFASSFWGFSFPNLPNILRNNFSITTSIPGRLISESKFGESSPLQELRSSQPSKNRVLLTSKISKHSKAERSSFGIWVLSVEGIQIRIPRLRSGESCAPEAGSTRPGRSARSRWSIAIVSTFLLRVTAQLTTRRWTCSKPTQFCQFPRNDGVHIYCLCVPLRLVICTLKYFHVLWLVVKGGGGGGVYVLYTTSCTVVADEIRNNHLGVYKQLYSPRHLCDCKTCMCVRQTAWTVNNSETITSHQEIEGTGQSDYSRVHLPQLYLIKLCGRNLISQTISTIMDRCGTGDFSFLSQ